MAEITPIKGLIKFIKKLYLDQAFNWIQLEHGNNKVEYCVRAETLRHGLVLPLLNQFHVQDVLNEAEQ